MEQLIHMIFKVNPYKRMFIVMLMLWEMKPNGSLSMLVTLIDTIKHHSFSNSKIEKKVLLYKLNISIHNTLA